MIFFAHYFLLVVLHRFRQTSATFGGTVGQDARAQAAIVEFAFASGAKHDVLSIVTFEVAQSLERLVFCSRQCAQNVVEPSGKGTRRAVSNDCQMDL